MEPAILTALISGSAAVSVAAVTYWLTIKIESLTICAIK